jgi:hypothetical protein
VRVLVLLVVSAGCKFSAPDSAPDSRPPVQIDAGPVPIDSSQDAQIVIQDGCSTFSSLLDTCQQTFGPPITIGTSGCWDTGAHRLYDPDCMTNPQIVPHVVVTIATGEIDLLIATEVTLNARLRVVGPIAFGVIATGPIVIGGSLDGVGGGPGGNAAGARDRAACATAAGGIPQDDGGGCPGGAGGNGDPSTAGAAGAGGGAIYLVSAQSIEVMRDINVGGGGGGGGRSGDGGGGGGGSGGMLLLEASAVQVGGVLAANGGGGGGGAGNPAGKAGQDGQASASPASGGSNGGAGVRGGAGGAGLMLDGVGVTDVAPGAGGGAGGGVGYIAIRSAGFTNGGTISPAATIVP